MSMTKAAPGDDPPSDEKTDELGPAQREAIRKFMLGLAIPAGVILSAVSFVLGFGINEVARGSAYTKAFGDAQSLIIAAAQASGAAQGKSEEAARQIVKLRVDIEDANRIVNKERETVKVLATDQYLAVAAALADNGPAMEKIAAKANPLPSELRAELQQTKRELKDALANSSQWVPDSLSGTFDLRCEYRWIVNTSFGKSDPHALRESGPYLFIPTAVLPNVIATTYDDRRFWIDSSRRTEMGSASVGRTAMDWTREVEVQKRCNR